MHHGRWVLLGPEAARVQTGYDCYFNERMNGFEYQAARHMIRGGIVQQGLAIDGKTRRRVVLWGTNVK